MTDKTKDEAAVLEKIATLEPHQDTAARLHEVILATAPDLKPRLWYGMPGYARAKSSPVIVFFRVDDGHMTFGITEKANLDREAPDHLIESAWFMTGMNEATEKRVAEIVGLALG